MSEDEGNYYFYTNKGRTYQFDLDDLSTEELKKFEKMSEKQRLRFIANFELQKETAFQDSISLKPTITEARNEEYNKYALLKQKLDEAESLGDKLKDYDNYENIELLDSSGDLKDEFKDYLTTINNNDIKNCMAAFDLDNVSIGMLKKYYKKKIEDLHITGIKTSFLESLKKLFKKFYEIEDENLKTTKPKIKSTLDKYYEFLTSLDPNKLTPEKTQTAIQTIYDNLGSLTLTALKKINIDKKRYDKYKKQVDSNQWNIVSEMLESEKILPKLQALIKNNLTTVEELGIDIIRDKPLEKNKNEETESINETEKSDTKIITKDEEKKEEEEKQSETEEKEEEKQSETEEKEEEKQSETEEEEDDINTPFNVSKKIDEKQRKVKEEKALNKDFAGFKNLFKKYFKSFVELKNYYINHFNEKSRGSKIPKKFNDNTIAKKKQGDNFLYREKNEDDITVKFNDNNISIVVGDGSKMTINYNLENGKYIINSPFYKIKSTFEPNEKNRFAFEFEKAKYDENKIKYAAFNNIEPYFGKGYTPKVKLSFYGKTSEGGSYKTTYTSGSLVDKIRDRFLKGIKGELSNLNEEVSGLKKNDTYQTNNIDKLTDKLNELEKTITALKETLSSKTQPKPEPKPEVPTPKPSKPSFLDDIKQNPFSGLKPVKPYEVRQNIEKEKTDLEKALDERRKDIEYSEDEEDDYEWGEGYGDNDIAKTWSNKNKRRVKLLEFLNSLN